MSPHIPSAMMPLIISSSQPPPRPPPSACLPAPHQLTGFSDPLRSYTSQLVRYSDMLGYTEPANIAQLCNPYTSLQSLTTVSIGCTESTQIEPLFRALSLIQQLVHLDLGLTFFEDLLPASAAADKLPPHRLAQLPSVRGLDLSLYISSHAHSQVEWLNLAWTLPNCEAIHFKNFSCDTCQVVFFYSSSYQIGHVPVCSEALECYHKADFHQLYRGVHLKKIILGKDFPLEQLSITDQ